MPEKKLTKVRISKRTSKKIRKESSLVDYNGAGDGIRTHDVLLGKQALYH